MGQGSREPLLCPALEALPACPALVALPPCPALLALPPCPALLALPPCPSLLGLPLARDLPGCCREAAPPELLPSGGASFFLPDMFILLGSMMCSVAWGRAYPLLSPPPATPPMSFLAEAFCRKNVCPFIPSKNSRESAFLNFGGALAGVSGLGGRQE